MDTYPSVFTAEIVVNMPGYEPPLGKRFIHQRSIEGVFSVKNKRLKALCMSAAVSGEPIRVRARSPKQRLTITGTALIRYLHTDTWRKRWRVECLFVGEGFQALRAA